MARQQERQELETRTTTARLLLERLREKLGDPSWEAKRELVEALVEGIRVDTIVENGKRMAKVTMRYRFDDKNANCSLDVLTCRKINVNCRNLFNRQIFLRGDE